MAAQQAQQNEIQAALLVSNARDHYHLRQFPEALDFCEQALRIDPNLALAHHYRGMTHFETGKHEQMFADFDRAVTLDPNNVRMLERIAMLMAHVNQHLRAIALLHRVIELDPNAEASWALLAECYYRVGKVDSARKMFEHAAKKFPDNKTIRLLLATFMPQIPMSDAEIDETCAAFIRNLDSLIKEGFTLTDPVMEMPIFPFYHAYYGRNCKAMVEKLAEFFLKACPTLNYTAPHCQKPRQKKNKIRIGFISEFMHTATILQFFEGMLAGMAKDNELEVIAFSTSPGYYPKVQEIAGKVHKYVELPVEIKAVHETVAGEEIDILFYLEIGIAHRLYFPALARLAPIQCTWGGHPLTTGIPTIDYFISTKISEADHPESHYTEKPLLLTHSLAVFARPTFSEKIKSRAELGLPHDRHLYACPVQLFKIHPDMDRAFAGILERDAKACILLFTRPVPMWQAQLEARFAKTIPAAYRSRILFVPFAEKDVFLDILRSVDAVLDPFHFSFGTTAYLSLGVNVPFVSWKGEFFRGRTGHWMYTRMQMPEMISRTQEEYVEMAVKLANDKTFYAEMSDKIRTRSHIFFDNTDAIGELSGCLKQLYADNFA